MNSIKKRYEKIRTVVYFSGCREVLHFLARAWEGLSGHPKSFLKIFSALSNSYREPIFLPNRFHTHIPHSMCEYKKNNNSVGY